MHGRILLTAAAAVLCAAAPAAAQVPLPTPLPGTGQNPPPGGGGAEPQRPTPAPPGGAARAAGEVGTYRGSPGRTGVMPDPQVFGPLRPLWRHELPGYVNHPLLVRGMVIANVGRSAGSGYGSDVIAWDAQTGVERWRAPTPGVYYSAHIASDGERVFSVNHDGVVRAFSVADGARLWEVQPIEQTFDAMGPIVSDGLVLWIHGSHSHGNATLFAHRAATGAEHFRRRVRVEYRGEMVVGGGHAYALDECGNATAVRLGDGEVAWTSGVDDCDLGNTAFGRVLAGGRLLAGRGRILDAATGAQVGRHDLAAPAVEDGVGYAWGAGSGGSGGGVRATALDGGGQLWSFTDPAKREFEAEVLPPVLVGPTLYVTAPSGRLIGLDRRSGRMLSATRVQGRTESSVGGIVGGLAAGQGVVAVTQQSTITVLTGVLRPQPRGTDIAATTFDVVYGRGADVAAAVGTDVAGREVQLQADRFPYGSWRPALRGPHDVDRTFYASLKPTRNTRYRLVTEGAEPAPSVTIRVVPRFSSRVRRVGRNRIEVAGRLRGPADMPTRGRRLVVYLGRVHRDRAERLGSAPLRRAGRGRAAARVRFPALRRVHRDDVLMFCVPGLARRGFGRLDGFERRCGARRIRLRLEPRS